MSITHRHRLFLALAWLCVLLTPAWALAQAEPARQNNIAVDLVAESAAAPGETIMLALHMWPAPGWHGYWLNPGDAGLGMRLDWELPEGANAGEPRYPVPQTLLISGLMNHVYKGDYAVLIPLTLPDDARSGTRLPVSVDASWLACTDEICVPEQARLSTTVEVGAKGARDPRFDRWRARLPAPLGAGASFSLAGDTLRLGIPLPRDVALERPHVFVAADKLVDYAAPQAFFRKGDLLIVELRRAGRADVPRDRFSALLRLNEAGDGLSFTASPGAVPSGGVPLGQSAGAAGASLGILLLGALAGGLLLNIMPCVFPILALKALSLAKAGESEAHARAEGLAYTAGVVTACLGLGAVMLGLRAAGEEVGWAFQLQEPGVVVALLLLATAITANFLGVFELAGPSMGNPASPRGAFSTGLLAAFVATPCTGPFMAAAMGAALLLPVVPAMALFAALGLGLALPFVAVAFMPPLRQRLPRPGAWMVTFRRWMALPMGLTALALLWLASRLGGAGFAVASACLAGLLVVLLMFAGRWQRAGRPALRLAAIGTAALTAIGIAILPHTLSAPASASAGVIAARPFSAAALAEARASGRPVFVWFTADWCITCKVNEQVAIERHETRRAFERGSVIALRGDWTRRDPAITRFLAEHGAAGVPLYVWYPAGGGEPRKLPQVLTPDTLVDLAAANGA